MDTPNISVNNLLKVISNFTPISQLNCLKHYNIIGVVINFSNEFKLGDKFRFKLKDRSGEMDINFYINLNGSLCPPIQYNFQLVIFQNLTIQSTENGSLFGVLTDLTSYKVFKQDELSKHPSYLELIDYVKSQVQLNSNSIQSSIGSTTQLVSKKRKHIEHNEVSEPSTSTTKPIMVQHSKNITPIDLTDNQPDDSPLPSSKYYRPDTFADIEPNQTIQIVAQVVKHERKSYNCSVFIITDYSTSSSLSTFHIDLPNSTKLSGPYFLKLTVWDNQVSSILNTPLYTYFHFSMVKAKIDRMNNLELVINGSLPNQKHSNISTELNSKHSEVVRIKRRMYGLLESPYQGSTQLNNYTQFDNNNNLKISSNTIRDDRFALVQDLIPNTFNDMVLLVLQVLDKISNKLTLLCTDFTQSQFLKPRMHNLENRIPMGERACIHLTCWDDCAELVNNALVEEPRYNILQFKNLNVAKNDRNGIELHLRMAVITYPNGEKKLNFDPIPNSESKYFQDLVSSRTNHIKLYTSNFRALNRDSLELMEEDGFDIHTDSNAQVDDDVRANSANAKPIQLDQNDVSKQSSTKNIGKNSLNNSNLTHSISNTGDSSLIDISSQDSDLILIDHSLIDLKSDDLVKYHVKLIDVQPSSVDKMIRWICTSGCWKSEEIIQEIEDTDQDLIFDTPINCKSCNRRMQLRLLMCLNCQITNSKPKQILHLVFSHQLAMKFFNLSFDKGQIHKLDLQNIIRQKLCKLAMKPFEAYVQPISKFEKDGVFQLVKFSQSS